MKTAPYVWSYGHSEWSRLFVSPDQALWIYHWDTGEWELIYQEATTVPASLAFSILYLDADGDSGGGGQRIFYGANDMEIIVNAVFRSAATYAYDRSGGGNQTTIVYFFIYGGPASTHSTFSKLSLDWTSASGGTYSEVAATMTSIGEIIGTEEVGVFEWVQF